LSASTGPASPSGIDWEDLHRRLQTEPPGTEHARSSADERKQNVLRDRARALARELKPEESLQDAIEVIEFVLAYERYAFESAFVREVHPLKGLTPVPCTPAYVAGIVNVRGQILSVLDIRKFFDLPQKGLPDLNKVIVLRSAAAEFGILADVIVGTRTISASELQSSQSTLVGISSEYLRGVAADRLVILDAGKLLADGRLLVHEEVGLVPGGDIVHGSQG
jgi:purine-binding chemotaxis protein CheW